MVPFLYKTFVNPKEPTTLWYVWAGGSLVLLWTIFWWSVGMLPAFGDGFALRSDVTAIRAAQLDEAIVKYRIDHCTAPDSTRTKVFYFERYQAKVQEYYELTGREYNVPNCSELVVND